MSRRPQSDREANDEEEEAKQHGAAASSTQMQPYQWPNRCLLPPAASEEPQIVLQNDSAMVLYEPAAHELVLYKQPAAAAAAATAAAASSRASFEANAIPSSMSAAAAAMQPFNAAFGVYPHSSMRRDEDSSQHHGGVCRLCHRPFWPSYPDEEYGDSGVGGGGNRASRQFTSSDYFKLLHSTEQAADATRAVHRESGEESKGEGRSRTRGRRGRSEQRGSVEIVEELPDSSPPPATRTRSRSSAAAAAAAAASATSPHERDIPIVHERQGRSSRAGTGMRIRRQQQLGASGSVVDLTGLADESTAIDDNEEDYDDTASTTSSSAAAAAEDVDVEDDVLACGLHRSSFNSGYYSKFFREECKLGSGGVGGVYLTHHVLDNVMLGTYAVKKIPVGNSRPWLLQVLKEVRALEGLHHRHIIAYKHSWLEEAFKPSDFGPAVPCLFLLMEYANRGTLANLIWPKVKTPATGSSAAAAARSSRMGQVPPPHVMQEEDVWWVFIGTCLGLRHLHRAGVIHDLKPENLLLSTEVDALGREHGIRVLVSDFGNAILKGVPYNRTGNTGTLAYSAPETLLPPSTTTTTGRFSSGLNSSPSSSPSSSAASAAAAAAGISSAIPSIEYDEKSDLWSCGIILFAMAFGRVPFQANSPEALFAEIRSKDFGPEGLVLPTTPARSPELKTIIRQLLSLDPSQRPGLDELLARPAIVKRREQRYAEFQQFRQQSRQQQQGDVYSSRTTETYRPPAGFAARAVREAQSSSGGGGGGGGGDGPSHALMISPNLLSSSHRGARSSSPVPLSLGPPMDSPIEASPNDSPIVEQARSINNRSRSNSGSGGGHGGGGGGGGGLGGEQPSPMGHVDPSMALVLSSAPSFLKVEEVDTNLPQPLPLILAAFNACFLGTQWVVANMMVMSGQAVSSPASISNCWRCWWNPTMEATVHMIVFVLKLWLSLSVLLDRPSAASMYLHVFPQVLLTLLLFFTTPLAFTANWMQLSWPSFFLQRQTYLPSVARRFCAWSCASPLRWQMLRVGVALSTHTMSAVWMDAVAGSGWTLQLFNGAVASVQCVALLCTFFSAHVSHLSAHSADARPIGTPPMLRTKLARSLSPPLNAARPGSSSSSAGVAPSQPPPPPSSSTLVTRMPLLLPATPMRGNSTQLTLQDRRRG